MEHFWSEVLTNCAKTSVALSVEILRYDKQERTTVNSSPLGPLRWSLVTFTWMTSITQQTQSKNQF